MPSPPARSPFPRFPDLRRWTEAAAFSAGSLNPGPESAQLSPLNPKQSCTRRNTAICARLAAVENRLPGTDYQGLAGEKRARRAP